MRALTGTIYPDDYRNGHGQRRQQNMARRTMVELVDDLDGSPAVATVRFGYDGRDYEIELSEEHAQELDELLAPYLEHARRVSDGGRAGRGRRSPRQPRPDTTALGQRHHLCLG